MKTYEDELKEERDEKEKELADHKEKMDQQAKDALPDPDEVLMDWEIDFIESISKEEL
tara:strand:- start:31 stop:204 length:174 start_codon:yes stop_codon:yes gene_type:complete